MRRARDAAWIITGRRYLGNRQGVTYPRIVGVGVGRDTSQMRICERSLSEGDLRLVSGAMTNKRNSTGGECEGA